MLGSTDYTGVWAIHDTASGVKQPGLNDRPIAREVLFEFSLVGNSVKRAVDPETMVEATIIGPVSAGEARQTRCLAKTPMVLDKGGDDRAKRQTWLRGDWRRRPPFG